MTDRVALIDTTRFPAWIGVVVEREPLVRVLGPGRRDGDRLVGSLVALLSECDMALPDLRGLVVVKGPGSFTGLRVGIASAQGLARSTGVPVMAVDGLELTARAVEAPQGTLLAPVAAGRGGLLYGSLLEVAGDGAMVLREPPAELPTEEWQRRCPPATRFLRAGGTGPWIDGLFSPPPSARLLSAARLVEVAAVWCSPEKLRPLYLRDWL